MRFGKVGNVYNPVFVSPEIGYMNGGLLMVGGDNYNTHEGGPQQMACGDDATVVYDASGNQSCVPITGGIKCPAGTALRDGACMSVLIPINNKTDIPSMTVTQITPANANVTTSAIDGITTQLKANPVIALGIAGVIVYLIAKR